MGTNHNGLSAEKLNVVFAVRVVEGGEQGFLDLYEWRSAEDFFAWQQSAEHQELVAPLREFVDQRQSMRFRVIKETKGVSA